MLLLRAAARQQAPHQYPYHRLLAGDGRPGALALLARARAWPFAAAADDASTDAADAANAAAARRSASSGSAAARPSPSSDSEPDTPSSTPVTDPLTLARARVLLGGGQARIDAQHAKHKLTARERLSALLDAGSFVEAGQLAEHRCSDFGMDSPSRRFPGDGVVTGSGLIHGRPVFCFAQDFTVLGGSLSEAHAAKISRLQDRALRSGIPLIALSDSGGARIQEGILSLAGYAEVFQRNVDASGAIPQISAIMGPCAGGAVYSPALTDFVFMVKGGGCMFLTGPDVVRAVTREEVTQEELGGASVHAAKSGVAAGAYEDDLELLAAVRELYGYLPLSCAEDPPFVATRDPPDRLCPALERGGGAPVASFLAAAAASNGESGESGNGKSGFSSIMPPGGEEERRAAAEPAGGLVPVGRGAQGQGAYDVRRVVAEIVDDRSFFEISRDHAPNVTVALARMGGGTVGIVANNPAFLAGVLDIDASVKAARFVRFCDAFNIPLVTLVDVPGFLPGTQQEHAGVIRHGAKLLFAYSEASVAKLSVVLRKAYGGAYCVMSSQHLRADANLAWPSAEVAVMGAAGAAEILYRGASPEQQAAAKDEYERAFCSPLPAARLGFLDDVIAPSETRRRLCRELALLRGRKGAAARRGGDGAGPLRKKHSCMPL